MEIRGGNYLPLGDGTDQLVDRLGERRHRSLACTWCIGLGHEVVLVKEGPGTPVHAGEQLFT